MNLIIIKDKLRDGLMAVSRASDEHQNLPILKNVLISSGDNQIKLVATNLEIAISYKVPGKVIEGGSVTIPVNTFLNIINNIQSERLTLEVKNDVLEVKTDNYQAKIQTLPTEDFPIIPQVKNIEEYITVDPIVLKEAISQSVTAAQFSDLRPELNTICLVFNLDSLVFAATDSFRLAEKTIYSTQFKTNFSREFSVLVPLKTANELLKIIKETDPVSIYLDQNQVLFKTDQFEFISRLSEGTFPDYKKVVPDKFDSEAIIKKDEFLNALKLTGVFGSKISEIKIKFLENKKGVEIFSGEEGLGENSYVLPAKIQGEEGEVGFNWRYLSEGLKALGTEEVVFGINKDNRPAIIKAVGDGSYFYILMPILKA